MVRMSRTLSYEAARRVYDRIGSRQDSQAFYEDRPVDLLVAHADFHLSRRVIELGCGTGRFALRLLSEELPADAGYIGVDISPEMVRLSRDKLARFGERAKVRLSKGDIRFEDGDASCDRFVSSYVLDLLSENDIRLAVAEAHRILEPGGLLCLVSLATGAGPASRVLASGWSRLHALAPELVGGCRPIDLLDHLGPDRWIIRYQERVAPFAVPSEIVVAERISPAAAGALTGELAGVG